ncbi:MAG: Protein translocase subunit SecE [Chloroflexi bacterium]|nr:Protein translocase subunit SecE [Chloroflexota bacterium]
MAKKSKKPNAIQRFYRETIAELRKVAWPTRNEALSLTRIVIVVIFSVGIFLGIVDFIFARLFAFILSL